MTELRTLLQAYLKTLHPRVYFQVADESAVFPYLVFDFPTTTDNGEWMQVVNVDVDGWDTPVGGDTTAIEALMTTVKNGLNKYTITSDSIGVTFYLESKHALQDDDKRIKRRKYIFEAHLFERSQ